MDLLERYLQAVRFFLPRRLRPVVRPEKRMSRFESLCELLLSSAGLIILTLFLPSSPSLALGSAARVLELTPIWSIVYVPFVLLAAANVVNSAHNFIRPFWTPARSVARIVLHAGTLLVLLALLRSGEWVAAKAGATLPNGESLERIVDIVNVNVEIGLTVVSIVKVIQIAWEILRVTSLRRAPSPKPAAALVTRWRSERSE